MTHLAHLDFHLSPLNRPPAILDAANGVLAPSTRKKVCIYGAGKGKMEAPLDDDAWEVWALNLCPPLDLAGWVRCDRWFDIHQRKAQSADDLLWIAACPVPIYVPVDLLDAGPNCVRFPLERLQWGPFACTFAYQIALALAEGFTEIGLHGVELPYGTERERTFEWASVNWWIGFAQARGVRFHLPSETLLGHHPCLYGLEYDMEKRAVEDHLTLLRQWDEMDSRRKSVGG